MTIAIRATLNEINNNSNLFDEKNQWKIFSKQIGT